MDRDEKHAFDNGSGMTETMTVTEMIAEIQRLGKRCELLQRRLHLASELAERNFELAESLTPEPVMPIESAVESRIAEEPGRCRPAADGALGVHVYPDTALHSACYCGAARLTVTHTPTPEPVTPPPSVPATYVYSSPIKLRLLTRTPPAPPSVPAHETARPGADTGTEE